jgi:hypothetical protein
MDDSVKAFLVSLLLTPQEPTGWRIVPILAILAAVALAYAGLEYGVGRIIGWVSSLVRNAPHSKDDAPLD